MVIVWVGAALLAVALYYWLVILTEGTYLGSLVVVRLYDWFAHKYDRVKNVLYVNELAYLGLPVSRALAGVPHPVIVDVATGTGRLPLAMVRQSDFDGLVVGVEPSQPMLAEARRALAGFEQAALVCGDSRALALADHSVDALTCLESLEFMAQPDRVLAEFVRVVKPGGVLLLSNRVGPDSWFFPGRIARRGVLEQRLRALGMAPRTDRWQNHYDLVWASTPSLPTYPERKDVALHEA
ncbi:MAG: methyltransferase domain-containing protein [Chloroflexi bacterium]|nr:methyltransferase domain-containing protein [Chloroflexota bacterium]